MNGIKIFRILSKILRVNKYSSLILGNGKPVILCGDLNVAHQDIDVHNPKGLKKCAGFTPQERESFGKFLDKGFVDTFRHFHPDAQIFSFWSAKKKARENNKGWRLDYFVTSKNMIDSIQDSEIY